MFRETGLLEDEAESSGDTAYSEDAPCEKDRDSDEQRIEPVFTELIALHTRRMDALGLTA